MVILEGYENVKVVQKDEELGCIPWAIEWMIRYKGLTTGIWEIPEADLISFQDRYNLGRGNNNYVDIINAVKQTYSNINLIHKIDYKNGAEKNEHINTLINDNIPIIMSVKLGPQRPAHCMPIYEVKPNTIRFINKITNQGNPIPFELSKYNIAILHDVFNKGKATASLH